MYRDFVVFLLVFGLLSRLSQARLYKVLERKVCMVGRLPIFYWLVISYTNESIEIVLEADAGGLRPHLK